MAGKSNPMSNHEKKRRNREHQKLRENAEDESASIDNSEYAEITFGNDCNVFENLIHIKGGRINVPLSLPEMSKSAYYSKHNPYFKNKNKTFRSISKDGSFILRINRPFIQERKPDDELLPLRADYYYNDTHRREDSCTANGISNSGKGESPEITFGYNCEVFENLKILNLNNEIIFPLHLPEISKEEYTQKVTNKVEVDAYGYNGKVPFQRKYTHQNKCRPLSYSNSEDNVSNDNGLSQKSIRHRIGINLKEDIGICDENRNSSTEIDAIKNLNFEKNSNFAKPSLEQRRTFEESIDVKKK